MTPTEHTDRPMTTERVENLTWQNVDPDYLDTASSASRQHHIDTGRWLTYDEVALDQIADLMTRGLADDGTWDGAADHLDAIAALIETVRTIDYAYHGPEGDTTT